MAPAPEATTRKEETDLAPPDQEAAILGEGSPEDAATGFHVRLDHFEGPFDLLLQLITRRRLDITEVALAQVTDEFLSHLAAQTASGDDWDLDEASEFLVVAATLLDLKAARLLPQGEVEDEADLALLEARDLLFARLLQYRAFKAVAEYLGERWANASRRYPRSVALEPHFAALLPPLELNISKERLAELAARAFTPKPAPQVSLTHLHHPKVTVAEEAQVVVAMLRARQTVTFEELAERAPSRAHVIARFLSLLELYRREQVAFEQPAALEQLLIRWQGEASGEVLVDDDYDDLGPVDQAGQEPVNADGEREGGEK